MEKIIPVTVRGCIAKAPDDALYICGNKNRYVVEFDFDDEWKNVYTKTARFIWNGEHEDKLFDGNRCRVPLISDTHYFHVGVFAGDLQTTTPAYVSAWKSILCRNGLPHDPPPDVYAQIMERLNNGVSQEQIEAAVKAYLEEHPSEGVTQEDLEKAVEEALAEAKESGEFKGDKGDKGDTGETGATGAAGKDGYTPQKGVDYFDGKDGQPGKDGAPGYTPQRGTDYWTADDRQQMVSDVLAALPTWEGGAY